MEQQILTVTVHRPLTRMERLRMRRRRKWKIIRTALWCLSAVAMIAAALTFAWKTPDAEAGETEIAGQQEVRVIFLLAEEFLQIEEPEVMKAEQPAGRYAPITEEERELIARIVYLEARGEPAEGQQAVAEVILNRVAAENFPDSVADVIFQENPQQFTTAPLIDEAAPGEAQYAAVDAATSGEAVLPMDVVYFSREPENGNVWGTIGGHVFCYQHTWE